MKPTPPASSRRAALGVLGALSALTPLALVPRLSHADVGVPAVSRIVVGFGAGGGIDLLARLIAERIGPQLGNAHRVIVDNRPGGGGQIAATQLLHAPTDGATYLLAPLITPVLSQLVYTKPGYDPAVDFSPVGLVAHFQFALAVPADHPARNATEFVAWLKAHPDKASFGSPAAGSLPHFFGLLLGQAAGVEIVHVPYKGGAAMLADLSGGQISSAIQTTTELLPLHQQGKIRILASFADRRLAELPGIPTFAELGYPKASGSGWYSLWARRGVAPGTLQAFNDALNHVLGEPELKTKLAGLALEPDPRTPAALEQLRVAEIEKWRPVIVASGFKAD